MLVEVLLVFIIFADEVEAILWSFRQVHLAAIVAILQRH